MFVLFCSFLLPETLNLSRWDTLFYSKCHREREEREREVCVNALFPNFNSTSRDSLKHCSPIINVSILEQYLGL